MRGLLTLVGAPMSGHLADLDADPSMVPQACEIAGATGRERRLLCGRAKGERLTAKGWRSAHGGRRPA